jgi:hypothetical protein
MNAPSFSDGLGLIAIKSSLDTTINNVSSTKQVVSSGGTGILVIAGDDGTRRYLHNFYP